MLESWYEKFKKLRYKFGHICHFSASWSNESYVKLLARFPSSSLLLYLFNIKNGKKFLRVASFIFITLFVIGIGGLENQKGEVTYLILFYSNFSI